MELTELLKTDPRRIRYLKSTLVALHNELGGLGGICQQLGVSGIGTRDELIARILMFQKQTMPLTITVVCGGCERRFQHPIPDPQIDEYIAEAAKDPTLDEFIFRVVCPKCGDVSDLDIFGLPLAQCLADYKQRLGRN